MRILFHEQRLTAKTCRERWTCCVNPSINKLSLTDAEFLLLIISHQSIQNMWSRMSKIIPRRYSSTLKNNFYSLVRSFVRKVLSQEFKRVSALFLLQIIYVSWVIAQLLARPADFQRKRGTVPSHIHSLIVKKGVTKAMCEEYLHTVIKCVLSAYKGRPQLAPLDKCRSLSKLYDLFLAVSAPLRAKFLPHISEDGPMQSSEVVEEAIVSELEKALNVSMVQIATTTAPASKEAADPIRIHPAMKPEPAPMIAAVPASASAQTSMVSCRLTPQPVVYHQVEFVPYPVYMVPQNVLQPQVILQAGSFSAYPQVFGQFRLPLPPPLY